MTRLMMFITEKAPISLRGELTRWMLQLKPGVFLGTLSALVGKKLWEKIQEKQKGRGAVWVKTARNEQKFTISTYGDTKWQITDFEGLQLITHPHKKLRAPKSSEKEDSINVQHESKKKKTRNFRKEQQIPKVTWDTKGLPDNFIKREVYFSKTESEIKTNFTGCSSYGEFSPHTLWSEPWKGEIESIGQSLISFFLDSQDSSKHSLYGKKIGCLDIETTDYLPKAYEGFINIIGLSILDLCKIDSGHINLTIVQVLNMLRKKMVVPELLRLILPYLKDIDVLLVFNRNFDIKILKTVIKDNTLKFKFPSKIIDLMDYFSSIKYLEEYLKNQVGVQRKHTEKGKYSDYYKLFKGKGKTGYKKKIEPIGTYNITDTLTPLYAYLILSIQDKI